MAQRAPSAKEVVMRRSMFMIGAALALLLLNVGVVSAAPPDNDRFGFPTIVRRLPFQGSVDTSEATAARTDPSCAGSGQSVWFRYRATQDGRIWAGVLADYDATLSVYTGTRDNLRRVACGDDPPEVVFHATTGTIYHFMVASCCGRDGGSATLNVDRGSRLEVADPRFETGVVETRTGDVLIRGQVSCRRTAGLEVSVHLRQRTSEGLIATGNGFVFFTECDGTYRGFRALVLGDRAFEPGWARLIIRAGACNPHSCRSAEFNEVVELVTP
jgi:hypothetical protein